MDQKAITGESKPVVREPGDEVFAGTVNGDGALEVVATSALGDALISRIIERVRAAQANRTPIERSIGRFAAVYTPIVVALAVAIMVVPPSIRLMTGHSPEWAAWVGRGLIALVVACPCALVIATPVAVASALASAARRGILIKGGSYLEEFGRLRVLAFDKTGTLTRGEPDVVEVVASGMGGGDELLRIAAALGEQGGHVLGRAISRHARGLRLDVPTAEGYAAVPGLGASGRVDSVEYHIGSHRFLDEAGLCPPDFHARLGSAENELGTSVALTAASGPLGWIRLADRARPEAAAVLADLKRLGVQTVMLTGDNPAAAEAMGDQVGIAERRAGLLPGDKADLITVHERRARPDRDGRRRRQRRPGPGRGAGQRRPGRHLEPGGDRNGRRRPDGRRPDQPALARPPQPGARSGSSSRTSRWPWRRRLWCWSWLFSTWRRYGWRSWPTWGRRRW